MRVALVAPFFVLATLPLRAQFFKGNAFLGGSVTSSFYSNVNTENASKSSNSNFSIQTSLGFMVSSKIAVGTGLGYTHSDTNFQYYLDPINPNGLNHSNLYSIAPFFRYFIPISNSIFFSLHSQFSYGLGHAIVGNYFAIPNSGVYVARDTDWSQVSVSSQPIFIFFPSPRWGIEAGLSSITYNYSVYRYNSANSTPVKQTVKNLAVNAGSIFFGLSYFFKKNRLKL